MPVVVWWAVGDLSAPEAKAIPDPDYQIHPFDSAPITERVVGVGAVVLVAVSVVALVVALWTRRMDRLWWPVLLQVSLAGAVCGVGWRVLTAAVIGANIGAGFVILFGGPLVVLMLVTALWRTVELLAQHRQRSTR
jgi:hypothetical protein